ncbi:MAG: hypothetical protein ABI467_28545 [Kofleriaceae bacterium]
MLGLGRLTKTVSDATIGTAIVLAHVVLADFLAAQQRQRALGRPRSVPIASSATPARLAD